MPLGFIKANKQLIIRLVVYHVLELYFLFWGEHFGRFVSDLRTAPLFPSDWQQHEVWLVFAYRASPWHSDGLG